MSTAWGRLRITAREWIKQVTAGRNPFTKLLLADLREA
jgi:hypothetical protein